MTLEVLVAYDNHHKIRRHRQSQCSKNQKMVLADRGFGSARLRVGPPLLLNGGSGICDVEGELLSRLIRVLCLGCTSAISKEERPVLMKMQTLVRGGQVASTKFPRHTKLT